MVCISFLRLNQCEKWLYTSGKATITSILQPLEIPHFDKVLALFWGLLEKNGCKSSQNRKQASLLKMLLNGVGELYTATTAVVSEKARLSLVWLSNPTRSVVSNTLCSFKVMLRMKPSLGRLVVHGMASAAFCTTSSVATLQEVDGCSHSSDCIDSYWRTIWFIIGLAVFAYLCMCAWTCCISSKPLFWASAAWPWNSWCLSRTATTFEQLEKLA